MMQNNLPFAFAKRAAFTLIYVLIAVMAVATFLEKDFGHTFCADNIYSSWWFALLWGIATIGGLCLFFRRRQPVHSVLLHVALALILVGALLTSKTSVSGQIHLRIGQQTDRFLLDDQTTMPLPATVCLTAFDMPRHAGTEAASNYVSHLLLIAPDGSHEQGTVSMNNVFTYHDMRFYQMSYDSDARGSYLLVRIDRWGTPVTYAGYYLLFVALVWMLISPKGKFRTLLRHPALRRGLFTVGLIGLTSLAAQAVPTLPRDQADRFGRLLVVYGDRVCPVQTWARDLTTKLYGSPYYDDYTPEQVLAGWLFSGKEWASQPIFKVKNAELRRLTGLPEYASYYDFFVPPMGRYVLERYVMEYYNGKRGGVYAAAAELEDKLLLVRSLSSGHQLHMFPITSKEGGNTVWYAPGEPLPGGLDTLRSDFINRIFDELTLSVLNGNTIRTGQLLDAIDTYQQRNGGASLPSIRTLRAERIYNIAFPLPVWLSRINLTIGLLAFVGLLYSLLRQRPMHKSRLLRHTGWGLLAAGFLALTGFLALRTEISGRLPLSNGYETMLVVAWCTQLLALAFARKLHLLLPFGFLLSGFFLLVSSFSQMNPQITPLVPVLNSPLLSIHVSLIMTAYALLSFTFLCAVAALILVVIRGGRAIGVGEQVNDLRIVSQLFLLPGLTFLGMGIFVGAIWANQSWGRYWGWDPKEVWALISFLFYAVAAHDRALPWLRRPVVYHIYMVIAFLSVAMTYWGVNYFLGGMHSYAG